MANLIDIGFVADTSQLQTAEQRLNRVATAGDNVDRTNARVSNSTRNASNSMGSFGRQAGQASIQIQQFTGQVQGGVNPLVALSQQAADLGIVLNQALLGSIVGIGAALAINLVPNLIDTDEQISQLIDRIGELQRASNLAADQTRFLARQNNERVESLSNENQAIAEQIEELENLQRARTTAGVGTDTGQFAVPRSAAENQARYRQSIEETIQELERLRAQLTTNNQEIVAINEETDQLINGNGSASEAIQELTSSLEAQIFELENGSEQAELYAAALATGAESIEDLDPGLAALIERVQELRREQQQESEFARRFREDQRASDAFVRQLERDYDRRIRAEARLSASLQQQIIQLRDGEEAARKYAAAQRLGLESVEALPEAIQRQIEELIALEEATEEAADEQERLGREAERAAREAEQAYERMVDSVTDGFEELFRDGLSGFDNFADSVVNIIERMVARMLAEIATAQLASAIDLQGLSGQAGGGGGLGSLGQQGGALGAIGQALPQVALAAFVFEAGRAISEALGGDGTIGGLFGGIVGSIFGGSFETTGAGVQLGVDSGIFGGQNFENQRRSGGLFRSSRRRTLTTALDAEVEEAFNNTFDHISTTVVDGLQILGFDVADNALEGFNSAIQQIEFGDDQAANQAAVEAYFNSLANEVAAFAQGGGVSDTLGTHIENMLEEGFSVPEVIQSFVALQQQSVLTFEKIERLSTALNATNNAFAALGIDAFQASVAGGELSEQLINMAGGLETFNANTANFANTFVDTRTVGERLNDVFMQLGLTVPQTSEGLVALVQSLDLTTEEGQRAFTVITSLTGALSEFYTEQERAAQEALTAAQQALRAAVQAEQERANEVLQIERDAHDARIALINEQRELANAQLQATRDSVRQQLESIGEQRDALRSSFGDLSSNLQMVQGLLRRSFSAEIDAIQTASNLRLEALNAESSVLTESVNNLTSLAGRLRQQSGLNNVNVTDALAAARAGDFSLAQNLQPQELGQQGFTSFAEQVFANAAQAVNVREIADLAGAQATEFEQQLEVLNRQIEVEQTTAAEQIDALNRQLDLLLGVNNSTVSVEEAVRQTQEAQAALDELNYEQQLAELDAQTETLEQQLEDAKAQHEQTIEELDRQATISEEQLQQAIDAHEAEIERLDAILTEALGLNDGILSVSAALEQLAEATAALAAVQNTGQGAVSTGDSAVGGSGGGSSAQEMMMELRGIRDEIRNGNIQVGKNTARTASELQRIKLDGLDVRQEEATA